MREFLEAMNQPIAWQQVVGLAVGAFVGSAGVALLIWWWKGEL